MNCLSNGVINHLVQILPYEHFLMKFLFVSFEIYQRIMNETSLIKMNQKVEIILKEEIPINF